MSGATGKFNSYVKEAKAAARTWKDNAALEELEVISENFKNAVKKSQLEMWTVNPSVHYDHWLNLSKEDFEPVVEAMHELCEQFICKECLGNLQAQFVGPKVVSVRCPCNKFCLNLVKKGRQ